MGWGISDTAFSENFTLIWLRSSQGYYQVGSRGHAPSEKAGPLSRKFLNFVREPLWAWLSHVIPDGDQLPEQNDLILLSKKVLFIKSLSFQIFFKIFQIFFNKNSKFSSIKSQIMGCVKLFEYNPLLATCCLYWDFWLVVPGGTNPGATHRNRSNPWFGLLVLKILTELDAILQIPGAFFLFKDDWKYNYAWYLAWRQCILQSLMHTLVLQVTVSVWEDRKQALLVLCVQSKKILHYLKHLFWMQLSWEKWTAFCMNI